MDEDIVTDDASDEVSVVDTSVYDAKIAELEGKLAEKEGELAAKELEISNAKAANYDLLKQIPSNEPITPETIEDEIPATIDDLFVENKDGN